MASPGSRRAGFVLEFDEGKGYGAISTDDGLRFFFHCTRISDGSRTIAVGTRVEFQVVGGRRGRWEAAAVSPPALSPRPDKPADPKRPR